MIFKLIGCLLIVTAGFLAGCMLSKRLISRKKFLKRFGVFLSSLSTNIRYNSADIFTLVNQSAISAELPLNCDIPRHDKPFDSFWEELIGSLPKSLSLNNSDKELLLEFGSQLGKTDLDGQLKHIELYGSLFETQLSNAEENIAKKSKLYKTMGFFIGASAALILI